MKALRSISPLAVLLLMCSVAHAQSMNKRSLTRQLRKIYKADQEARNAYLDLFSKNDAGDSIAIRKAERRIPTLDSTHYIALQKIFKAVGYPDRKESGGEWPHEFLVARAAPGSASCIPGQCTYGHETGGR